MAALATLVAAIPARVEQRPVEAPRRPRRAAIPRRCAAMKPRAAWRAPAPRVEEIVATCGVAGSEARLLRRLHGAEPERESAA